MSIADVLRPSDMELLDEQLRSVIESDDPALRSAVAGLRDSWPGGHDAVRLATASLDTALGEAGIVLGHGPDDYGDNGRVSKYSPARAIRPSRISTTRANGKSSRPFPSASRDAKS